MRKVLTAVLAMLGLFSAPALAQFIGFTSPQTVQQRLGAAENICGGATVRQDYAVQNLGQTEHFLTVIAAGGGGGTATQFTVAFWGVDVNGNRVQISDELDMAGAQTGALFASGYYPKVWASVTCAPTTATYALTYSGTWGTPAPAAGVFLQTQINKAIWSSYLTQGFTQTRELIPPFGASAGVLYFTFNAGGNATSTVAVNCLPGNGGAVSVLPATTLANVTTTQIFEMPNTPCPLWSMVFTGPGGATVSVSAVFATPGFSNWPIDVTPTTAAARRPVRRHH